MKKKPAFSTYIIAMVLAHALLAFVVDLLINFVFSHDLGFWKTFAALLLTRLIRNYLVKDDSYVALIKKHK